MSGGFIDPFRPTHKPWTYRDPIVAYIATTYAGDPALSAVALQLRAMSDDGVTLTRELVDHAFRKAEVERLRAWHEEQSRKREERNTPVKIGYVYFIEAGNRIKIGYSIDPGKRALSLSLRENDVMAVIEGTRTLERSLHAKFGEHRIGSTEWFDDCPEIREYVQQYGERFTKHHRSRKDREKPTGVAEGYARLARSIAGEGL